MTDVLKTLTVDVHCDQCGDFTVGADVIAESQRILAGGCPGSSYECPPSLFATLLPRQALESFERAWSDLERTARSPVQQITIEDLPHVLIRPDGQLDPRAIARWEDDGGHVPAGKRRTPC